MDEKDSTTRGFDPVAWLLSRRLVRPEQVDECRGAGDGTPEGLVKLLVARGYVDPIELGAMHRAHDDTGATALGTDIELHEQSTERADAAKDAPPPPPRRLAQFEVMGELGRGGMGAVYKAWDTQLQRVLALKLLPTGEWDAPSIQERFMREARAAAKLTHPNIVQVHEVGAAEGHLYLAMEFIDGPTLRGYCAGERRDLRELVGLVKQVADGIGHAHREGILHRDIKPQNILIDSTGRAHVSDFGLALDLWERERLTVTGEVLGTPSYMAPEQAEGEIARMGPATDVYGIGAVLYEVMTGLPPFTAPKLVEVLRRVVNDDVTPPSKSNPRVPGDLEVICLKCLEKDPSRRYATATELAEELKRYLDGEAILARPASLRRRAWKRLRRHTLAGSLTATVLVAGVVVGTIYGGARRAETWQAAERKRLTDVYRLELARSGEVLVDAALARRAMGDLATSRRHARALDARIEELLRIAPELPDAWFYRGRMLRVEMRDAEAEQALTQALERAEAPGASVESAALAPKIRLERAMVRFRLYYAILGRRSEQWVLERAGALSLLQAPPSPPGPFELARIWPEIESARQVTLDDLRVVARREPGPDEALPGAITAAGLLLLLEGEEPAIVRRTLESATLREPYCVEAYTALAEVSKAVGDTRAAVDWYERALEVDEGNSFVATLLEPALHDEAASPSTSPSDARRLRAHAREVLETVVAAHPEQLSTRCRLSHLNSIEGFASLEVGEDPSSWFLKAEELVAEVVRQDPAHGLALTILAWARSGQAAWRSRQGQDPLPDLRATLDLLVESRGKGVKEFDLESSVGMVHLQIARELAQRGDDPDPEYEEALSSYLECARRQPRGASHYLQASTVLFEQAERALHRDEDPLPLIKRGQEACESVLAIDPDSGDGLARRASLALIAAHWSVKCGRDPIEAYASALRLARDAAKRHPTHLASCEALARAAESLSQAMSSAGEDATTIGNEALDAANRAVALAPNAFEYLQIRGVILLFLAKHCTPEAAKQLQLLQSAIKDLEKHLSLRPRDRLSLGALADAWGQLGHLRLADGHPPTTEYSTAIEACDRILSIGAHDVATVRRRAALHERMANWRVQAGEDPLPEWSQAVAGYQAACAIEPGQAEYYTDLARALLERRSWAKAPAADSPADMDAAIEATRKACELDCEPARRLLAYALLYRAEDASPEKEDPRPLYEAASEAFAGEAAKFPSEPEWWKLQGHAWWRVAWEGSHRGADPRPAAEKALRAFSEMWARVAGPALPPESQRAELAKVRLSTARVYAVLAAYAQRAGDQASALRAVEDAFRELRAALPLGLRGRAEFAESEYLESLRDDPGWEAFLREVPE